MPGLRARISTLLALSATALVATACPTSLTCETGADCASGRVCVDGTCQLVVETISSDDDAGRDEQPDASSLIVDAGAGEDAGDPGGADGGAPTLDGGATIDAGLGPDAGNPTLDAGVADGGVIDSGAPDSDAGAPGSDAGAPDPDAGPPTNDCGNGELEAPEECDDGNLVSGDGCDDQCVYEWWDVAWRRRALLTITNWGAWTGLDDAPVLVTLDGSDFDAARAAPDGSDLRFVSYDQSTVLAHDVDVGPTSEGTAIVWLKVPTLPVSPNTLKVWMYYDNPTPPMTDERATWSRYDAVWHLGQDTEDSVSLASGTAVLATPTAGIAGQAHALPGYGSYIDVTNTAPKLSGDITFEGWVRFSSIADGKFANVLITHGGIPGQQSPLEEHNFLYGIAYGGSTGRFIMYWENGPGTYYEAWSTVNANLQANNWYHVAVQRDATSKLVRFYVQGSLLDTVGYQVNASGGESSVAYLGADPESAVMWDMSATLDEVRISHELLTSTHIAATAFSTLFKSMAQIVATDSLD